MEANVLRILQAEKAAKQSVQLAEDNKIKKMQTM